MKRVRDNHVAAVGAGRAQVVQPLQVAALALPVADRVVHKLKLGDIAEVGDREHGGEHRLQAVVITLLRQLVHQQEALIAAALNLDQIWNLDRGGNLGKIETAADRAHFAVGLTGHALS